MSQIFAFSMFDLSLLKVEDREETKMLKTPRKSRLKRAVESFRHHRKAVKVHNKVEVVQLYILFCEERYIIIL